MVHFLRTSAGRVPLDLAVALGHKVCSPLDKHISILMALGQICSSWSQEADSIQQTMPFYGPLSSTPACLHLSKTLAWGSVVCSNPRDSDPLGHQS